MHPAAVITAVTVITQIPVIIVSYFPRTCSAAVAAARILPAVAALQPLSAVAAGTVMYPIPISTACTGITGVLVIIICQTARAAVAVIGIASILSVAALIITAPVGCIIMIPPAVTAPAAIIRYTPVIMLPVCSRASIAYIANTVIIIVCVCISTALRILP